MKINKLGILFLLLFSLTSLANKKVYDEYASKNPNTNDVKALIYNWFATLDHQSDIYWFFPHLANDFSVNFEGEEAITTKDGLIKWYETTIKENIEWNTHSVDSLKIDVKGKSYAPSQFIVEMILTWGYENYDKRDRFSSRIAQTWDIVVEDNKLKVRKISSKAISAEKKI